MAAGVLVGVGHWVGDSDDVAGWAGVRTALGDPGGRSRLGCGAAYRRHDWCRECAARGGAWCRQRGGWRTGSVCSWVGAGDQATAAGSCLKQIRLHAIERNASWTSSRRSRTRRWRRWRRASATGAMRFRPIIVVLALALAGCGAAVEPSVASRCSDYGARYAKQVARRFPRPSQQRTLRIGEDAYCLFHARRLKMPANPTDVEWNKVLRILNPPAVTIRRARR